jgi:hypothetical protein
MLKRLFDQSPAVSRILVIEIEDVDAAIGMMEFAADDEPVEICS